MESSSQTRPILLRMSGIHKRFPGVHALKAVDFDVLEGEVHALVGENGAGKSTLMHILAGVHPQDEGEIAFNGSTSVRIVDERSAQAMGIGIVYQERSLVPTLNVAENVFAARQPINALGMINRGKLYKDTQQLLDRLNIRIKPTAIVEDISPALQQMIEIAKAISMDARLLIFDEPTAALTENEKNTLFDLIRQLKQHVGIIYISHRLEEIFEIADRVTVLKDGEKRGTFPVAEVDRERLISLMVGRKSLKYIDRTYEADLSQVAPILEVRSLSDHERVRDVSFSLKPGEIVAFAGLAGAGRTETALALFGAAARASGEIFMNGKRLDVRSPEDAIRAGIGYLSEDRRSLGLFLEMPIFQNIASASLAQFGSLFLNKSKMVGVAEEYRQKLSIATPGVSVPVQNLSGGNQQKVVISRWLLVDPKVLIIDEPTRGIDVGAKAEVHALLQELARRGAAIMLISSELPEVLAVADRILVMCEGRISGELDGRTATEEEILHLAAAFEPRAG
jgi:ABC-type sugar transport system ATPase subunit